MGFMLALKMPSEFEWKAQYQGDSCGVILSTWRLGLVRGAQIGKLNWKSFLESHSSVEMEDGKDPRHGQRR